MAIIDSKTGKAIWYKADHGEQRDPFRDWIRENCPTGRNGVVVENLDLVVNVFGKQIGRTHNEDGRIKLIEKKMKGRKMNYAQTRTFGLLNKLLIQSDPERKYYRGLYTISVDGLPEDFSCANYSVTNHQTGQTKNLDSNQLIAFLKDEDLA
jgi:hypothetical protein